MEIEFDASKSERNAQERGLSFSAAEDFDWTSALIVEDARADYGETRMFALGLLGGRLHALAYTMRGEVCRIISLRRANDREVQKYEKARSLHDR